MKVHPVGVIGKRDVRINKLISKLYNRKEYYDGPDEMGNTRSTTKK